jgi:predicted dehydrogenase
LFAAHVLRYVPEYVAARARVVDGSLGPPAVIRLKRAAFRPGHPAEHWLFDPTRSGGMIVDLMIHDYDFARWVAGDVVAVHARSAAAMRPERPVEHAYVILTHASGAISHVTGSWAYGRPTFRTGLSIACAGGLIEYDSEDGAPLAPYVHRASDDQGAVGISRPLLDEDPFRTQVREFATAIGGGPGPRVTAADGLAALRIALAAAESARTGRVLDPGTVA